MTTAGRITKIAIVREDGYPVGMTAPCWMYCTCGDRLPALNGNQECPTCHVRYDGSGWVLP